MSEWISVEDRLPDADMHYLVHSKRYGVQIDRYKGFWEGDYPVEDLIVTHWMPLPQPPKDTK